MIREEKRMIADELNDLWRAVTGGEMSSGTLEVYLAQLVQYDYDCVQSALNRCRSEINPNGHQRLTLRDIVSRLPRQTHRIFKAPKPTGKYVTADQNRQLCIIGQRISRGTLSLYEAKKMTSEIFAN